MYVTLIAHQIEIFIVWYIPETEVKILIRINRPRDLLSTKQLNEGFGK